MVQVETCQSCLVWDNTTPVDHYMIYLFIKYFISTDDVVEYKLYSDNDTIRL